MEHCLGRVIVSPSATSIEYFLYLMPKPAMKLENMAATQDCPPSDYQSDADCQPSTGANHISHGEHSFFILKITCVLQKMNRHVIPGDSPDRKLARSHMTTQLDCGRRAVENGPFITSYFSAVRSKFASAGLFTRHDWNQQIRVELPAL